MIGDSKMAHTQTVERLKKEAVPAATSGVAESELLSEAGPIDYCTPCKSHGVCDILGHCLKNG